MKTISQQYIKQNEELHQSRPDYGSSGGQKWATPIAETANGFGVNDILDYGAGKQSLSRCMPAYKVTSYDPAVPEISARPKPHSVVACLDVMEHIEPEYLDAVLTDIHELTQKGVVFVIATGPAKKTLPDGRNAHLIQEDYQWWFSKLCEKFEISQFNNLGYNILFICVPRIIQ